MSGFVYFLMAAKLPAFKIGSSHDTTRRAATIGEDFDYSESFQIKTKNRRDAYTIERVLHFMYRNHKFNDAALCGDGHTEWFSSSVFFEVRDFLLLQKEQLGFLKLLPVKAPIARLDKTPQIDHDHHHQEALQQHISNGILSLPTIFDMGGKSLNQLARAAEKLRNEGVQLILTDSTEPEFFGETALSICAAMATADRHWKNEREKSHVGDGKKRGTNGGRPSLSQELISEMQALAASGRGPAEVCKALGIGRSTFYKHTRDAQSKGPHAAGLGDGVELARS